MAGQVDLLVHDLPRPHVERFRHVYFFSKLVRLLCPTASHLTIRNRFKYGIRTLDDPLVPRAQTAWFIEGALTQILIVHVLRTHKIPFIQSTASIQVITVTFLVGCVAVAIPYVPKLNVAVSMIAPAPDYYGFLVAILFTYMVLVQLVKTLYVRLFHDWL
jgi:Mg2+-importing ATPase